LKLRGCSPLFCKERGRTAKQAGVSKKIENKTHPVHARAWTPLSAKHRGDEQPTGIFSN